MLRSADGWQARARYIYYACERKPRRDAGKAWFDRHPTTARVRAEALHDAVHEFFPTRILGPDRHRLLAATLTETTPDNGADEEGRLSEVPMPAAKDGDVALVATLPELSGDFSRSPEDLQRAL